MARLSATSAQLPETATRGPSHGGRGVGLWCPVCGQRMRLASVSRRTSGYDPSAMTYRHSYRRGIAVCEDDHGAVRHGPFIGWTSDLDADGDVVWLAWEPLEQGALANGCLCSVENRETCLGGLPA